MLLNNLRGWLNRDSATAQRQRRSGNAQPTRQRPKWFRPKLEELEDRTLLSTIDWLNDGSVPSTNPNYTDPDDFNRTFGADAAKARAIVHEAIFAWEELIVNFNYTNVGKKGYAYEANTLYLEVQAEDLGGNTKGTLSYQSVDHSFNDSKSLPSYFDIGKPYTAAISVDDNGGGNGWYFDPTPRDSSEFTKIITPFRAQGDLGGRADFYSTVLREIGKAVGIVPPPEYYKQPELSYLEDFVGPDPVHPGARIYSAQSSALTGATFLTDGGEGGIYEGPRPSAGIGGFPPGPNDRVIFNDLMTADPPVNTRDLITDVDIGLLLAGFTAPPYKVIYPSLLGRTFLDAPEAGTLTIRGSSNNDTITVVGQNNTVVVTINGNQSVYQGDFVRSVRVLAGAGNDTIRIDMQGLSDRSVFVDGGAGADSITLVDNHDVAGSFTYTVTNATVTRDQGFGGLTYANVEKLMLLTAPGTVNVESTAAGTPVTITGSGNTTVKVSPAAHNLSNIAGDLTLNVQAGLNTLFINDQAFDSYSARYNITANSVQRERPVRQKYVPTGLITYNGFTNGVFIFGGKRGNQYQVFGSPSSFMGLNTGAGVDTVNIFATTGPVTVDGQGGADTVNVGNNGSVQSIAGTLKVFNSGDLSTLNIDDTADARARTVTMSVGSAYGFISGLAPALIAYLKDDIRSLTVSSGSGGNTFTINDTLPPLFPDGTRIRATLTSVNTGNGADQVYVLGTTGPLAVNVQGAFQGRNTITVGSPTAGLNAINGPINVTGLPGAVSALYVNDAASTISHEYIVDRNFVQRVGKAQMDYLNLTDLNLGAGAQTDHIIVQDTMPRIGNGNTTIAYSGGDDRIDISRTTGPLSLYPGGHSVVSVGNATSSLDNIRGAIAVIPFGAGNAVTLSLNDQAATKAEQLDIAPTILGTSFQRSGAANIAVLVNPLGSFQWRSGKGGTKINSYVRPAQTTSFILGNDELNIGTRAGTISDFGLITVTGGIGPDAVLLNDSGETRKQSYNVSQVSGREIFATRGTIFDLGPDLEVFEVMGGGGGNTINITGTIAGMSTVLHTGAGLNTVTSGGAGNSLQAIQGPVTLDGVRGTNTLIVNDQGNSLPEEYLIDNTTIKRANTSTQIVDATIDYSGFAAVVLNGSSGGVSSSDFDIFQVAATPAGTSVTLNGGQSISEFAIGYPMDAIQGPLSLHGQSGHDFALFNDGTDPIGRTFTLTSNQLATSGIAPISFDGLMEAVLYNGAGSDAFNVQSVAPGVFVAVVAGASDSVVIGSQAPALGGSLANILGPVRVESAAGSPVTVMVDDSGDAVSRQVSLTADTSFGPGIVDEDITGLAPATIILNLHSGAATTVLAGSGDDTFNVQATQADAPLTIDLGTGDDTVNVGSAGNTLDAIQGALTLDGQDGVNQVTFNDQGTTTLENYSLTADQLTRAEATGVAADMAPISFAGFAAITLNVGSGGSATGVYGSVAGSTVTVNGNTGSQDEFGVDASTNAILGPVIFNCQSADADFAQYYDIGNTAPHTYTLTSTSVSRDGQAPVFSQVGAILYAPMVGGNTVNVNSVAPAGGFLIQAANGDHVTVGSLAPGLGGTLADILGEVNVVSYTPNDAVTLVLDDSGNTDTTAAKHITFGKDANGLINLLGLTPSSLSWMLPSASSVTVLGGAADETFSMQSLVAATPLTIVGGTGSNTLDYSSYTTDVSVNLQTGTATDLAGISDPHTGRVTIQNVIGGSANDTLSAGADRSILIGGGADQLFGGSGEDILIAGTTDYTQPGLNAAALDAVVQEWNRTDLGFDDRLSDLMIGSNSQGAAAKNVIGDTAILLGSTTVHNELAAGVLTGGTGRDWYFFGASDLINNQKAGDLKTLVGNTNQLYVNSLWLKLLGRNATGAELNATNNLDLADSSVRTSLINGITSSLEYQQDTVDQIYQHYLHRTAFSDPVGLSGFTTILASGVAQQEVAALVLGSPDYFSASGGSNFGFINALYHDTLGRVAVAGEFDAFMNQLNSGASRTTVARELLNSREYLNNLVNFPAASGQITTTNPFLPYGYYQLFLGRNADAFEANGFINELQAGVRNETVIAQILSSAEYFNKSPQTAVIV